MFMFSRVLSRMFATAIAIIHQWKTQFVIHTTHSRIKIVSFSFRFSPEEIRTFGYSLRLQRCADYNYHIENNLQIAPETMGSSSGVRRQREKHEQKTSTAVCEAWDESKIEIFRTELAHCLSSLAMRCPHRKIGILNDVMVLFVERLHFL